MDESPERLPISQWAEDDRPREKLVKNGKNSLSDAELLAILLRSGSREKSAVELARSMLQKCGNNLIQLSRQSVGDLMKFKGVGEAKALSIVAALELGLRRRHAEVQVKQLVGSSKDAFELFYPFLTDNRYETFWVLFMNRSNCKLAVQQISEGGQAGTVADPKKIFKMALEHNASSMILCHNHPSGNLKPSEADVKLTRKLKEAGQMMDLPVLDHLIIGDEKYYSFADEGML
ncbi:MAG: DNA repair protein RadC [Bacteroidales bacterium]|nr:DNA repair protein RadC [Bacteroidales bacterium]